MVHTKDGSRAVREFLVQGTAKVGSKATIVKLLDHPDTFSQDRKQIVKNMKEHARKMAQDDSAQLALFTALDVIEYVILSLSFGTWPADACSLFQRYQNARQNPHTCNHPPCI